MVNSIVNEPRGRDIDYLTTVGQIGMGTIMSVGWQPKTVVKADDWFKVKVSGRFWLTIKLNAGDLYDVEIAQVVRSEYVVLEQERDVYADMLAETVRRLGDRA